MSENKRIIDELASHHSMVKEGDLWWGTCPCDKQAVGEFCVYEKDGVIKGGCVRCGGADLDLATAIKAAETRARSKPESREIPAEATPEIIRIRTMRQGIRADVRDVASRRSASKSDPSHHYTRNARAAADRLIAPFNWPENPPRQQWIVKWWIPSGRITLLTGAGGHGKSRLALQLAAAVAHEDRQIGGNDWLGGLPESDPDFPTIKAEGESGDVLIYTWEDDVNEITNRLYGSHSTIQGASDARLALGDRVKIIDMAGKDSLWAPELGQNTGSRCWATPEGIAFANYVKTHEPTLVILDPLAAVFTGNENDRSAVREFMGWLGDVARPKSPEHPGTAILIIAHPPKDQKTAYSGSTDWHASARSVIALKRGKIKSNADEEDGTALDAMGSFLSLIKHNHAPPQAPIALRKDETPNGWLWHRETDPTQAELVVKGPVEQEKPTKPKRKKDPAPPIQQG